jgi:hypothetical protein
VNYQHIVPHVESGAKKQAFWEAQNFLGITNSTPAHVGSKDDKLLADLLDVVYWDGGQNLPSVRFPKELEAQLPPEQERLLTHKQALRRAIWTAGYEALFSHPPLPYVKMLEQYEIERVGIVNDLLRGILPAIVFYLNDELKRIKDIANNKRHMHLGGRLVKIMEFTSTILTSLSTKEIIRQASENAWKVLEELNMVKVQANKRSNPSKGKGRGPDKKPRKKRYRPEIHLDLSQYPIPEFPATTPASDESKNET